MKFTYARKVVLLVVMATTVFTQAQTKQDRTFKGSAWTVPTATLLTADLASGSGSAVGPDGALYVTEGAIGRISRVDPQTGEVTTFASGLPIWIFAPVGGVMDIAFIGNTAYVLVSVVGPEIGGNADDVVGIYRVDGPDSFTIIADIGAFSLDNPPLTSFFIPTGVQYALEPYRGGFLVTDGHHNRVLRVTRNGEITEFQTFGNIVPTGLAVWGNTIYMAEAGPLPHRPEDGKVVSFTPQSEAATEVGSGVSLLVDVEFGRGRSLYALSQGDYSGAPEGFPGLPDTGELVEVYRNGTFSVIVDGLDRPTSFEIIGNTAYIVTIDGEIWEITDISSPPYGRRK